MTVREACRQTVWRAQGQCVSLGSSRHLVTDLHAKLRRVEPPVDQFPLRRERHHYAIAGFVGQMAALQSALAQPAQVVGPVHWSHFWVRGRGWGGAQAAAPHALARACFVRSGSLGLAIATARLAATSASGRGLITALRGTTSSSTLLIAPTLPRLEIERHQIRRVAEVRLRHELVRLGPVLVAHRRHRR